METRNITRLKASGNGRTSDGISGTTERRLSVFIRENVDQIVGEWEAFARTLIPSADDMTPLALRDHIRQILEFVVSDMETSQTPKEQVKKSLGKKEKIRKQTAAETHAALRLAGGFDIGEMVSEYRALRASVVKLWTATGRTIDANDMADLTRFNEAIDQELTESVSYYSIKVIQSKDLLIGILGHDLRSPVQGIMLSAELMLHMGTLNERQTMLTTKMLESSDRISVLISNLLDVTRARFGAGLQVSRAPMDMGFVGRQIVDEVRVVHPNREIFLGVSGDLKGEWDRARIGQVFSNLLGNAIQYSFKDSSIQVMIKSDLHLVTVSVHNVGLPIAPRNLKRIFNPLSRATTGNRPQDGSTNLGLGLFITEEVVLAHGGTIHVKSSEADGTTFEAHFPRSVTTPPVVRQLRLAG